MSVNVLCSVLLIPALFTILISRAGTNVTCPKAAPGQIP